MPYLSFSADFIQSCDVLQQNRQQVAQANFEIWANEVGIGVKNDYLSILRFFFFFFFAYLKMSSITPM